MNKVTVDGPSSTQLPLNVPRREISTPGNVLRARTLRILAALSLFLFAASSASAQNRFLRIPASGFTPQTSEGTGNAGYEGNATGTARLFAGSSRMFAPVNLPDGAMVTGLQCGGMGSLTDGRLVFTLRRNQPQVVNVDMVVVATSFAGTGFEGASSTAVTEPEIDNFEFNYYMVAEVDNQVGANLCPTCTIGFCRIRYTR